MNLLINHALVLYRPENILAALAEPSIAPYIDLFEDIFPSRVTLEQMLSVLPPDPISSSLGVMDPLIPPASQFFAALAEKKKKPTKKRAPEPPQPAFDAHGYSSYARAIIAMLQVFLDDRQVAKNNTWALRHFIAFSLYAEDYLNVPHAKSAVFHPAALGGTSLLDMISRIKHIATYILTSAVQEGWKTEVLRALIEDTSTHYYDPLSLFLVDIIQDCDLHDYINEARLLRRVLQHILDDADIWEADKWIEFAKFQDKRGKLYVHSICRKSYLSASFSAPLCALTIVASVVEFAPDPPSLDLYRTSLAALLTGIPASKANTDGVLALRKLAASAPGADSDVVFLTQQRAVNVVKTCQQWILADDEDIDEEVESAMTLIFSHLAPILQNVPGGHWGFIFDVIESNLEVCLSHLLWRPGLLMSY